VSSLYLGIVTPGRLGKFAKAIYLNQEGITSVSHGFSSVLIDRLCDLYLLFLLAMAGFISLVLWEGADAFGWSGLEGAIAVPLIFCFRQGPNCFFRGFIRKF